MRRFAIVGAALVAFALVFGVASSAYAHPTLTSKCSGCHSSNAAVTLAVTPVSSTATTATYSVAVGNPYGTVGWGVFSGSTKLAGTATASGTFSVATGATYTVYGVSGNNNGTEGYSSTTISPVKPALPATPTIAASFSTASGSVPVSWTAVTGATSYDYQVGTGSVLSTTSTSIVVSGLAAGTTAFKVRAVNANGAGGYANSSLIYTAPAPAAPSISTTYTTVTGSVTVSWPAVSGATTYDYQLGAGSVVSTSATSVTVSGLALGTTAFKVRATNTSGSSAYSSAALVYTALIPAAPSIAATFTTSNGTVNVTWAAVPGATGYDYQVGSASVVSTTSTSITVSGLGLGSTVFQVRAKNSGGASAYSPSTLVYTPPAPAAPSISTTYTTGTGAVTVSWPAVSGATSYDYQVGAGSVVTTTSTSVAVSGLAVGTTAFKVRATNTGGSSAYASASLIYTPPAPVAPSVSATYTTTTGSAAISWAAVPNATSYDYQVGAGSVVSTSATSITVSGLTLGTTAFKVRATNTSGSSAYAAANIVYTAPVAAPGVPSIATTYTTGTNSVTISWAAVAGATTYDYRVAAGSTVSTSATSVTVTGLSAGSTAFRIRATNVVGSSAYVNSTIVYIVPPVAPSISATYTTTSGSTSISWAAVSGATSYDYQLGAGSVLTTTATSLNLTGLSVGTTAFKLRATNAGGSSAYANAAIVYTVPPAAPSLSATYTTSVNSVTITWPAVASATGYDYQVAAGSVVSTTSTSVTVTGLSLGTTAFKVRAKNSAGSSAYAVAAISYVPPAPGAPTLSPTFSTLTGSVSVSWTAVSGATGYDYQVGAGTVVSTTGTSVVVNGLAAGTTDFKVRAKNSGGTSAYATAQLVYTVPPAAPSVDATYTTNNGSVTILWPAVSGATSYDYQVGSSAVTSTSATSASIDGLALGTTSFKVRAKNIAGASSYVTAAIVYTVPAPGAPAIDPTFTTSNGSLTVTWAAVDGATHYDYQIGNGSIVETTALSVAVKGLSVGSTPFAVRGCNAGGDSDFSISSLIYTLPPVVPAAPALAAKYTSGSGTVLVTWPAVPGATSYEYYVSGGVVNVVTTNSIQLSGLVRGSSVLHVRAVNIAGKSAYTATTVTNTASGTGVTLKLVTLRTSPKRWISVRGTLTNAVPIGRASIRVYIRNAKTGKYKLYAYSAPWTYGNPTSQFSARIHLPKTGKAYVVISGDGLKVKSKTFKIKK